MIYELRVYTALPGRMPDLLARFKDHTVSIWQTHGIIPVGFWTTLIGHSTSETDLHSRLEFPRRPRHQMGCVSKRSRMAACSLSGRAPDHDDIAASIASAARRLNKSCSRLLPASAAAASNAALASS